MWTRSFSGLQNSHHDIVDHKDKRTQNGLNSEMVDFEGTYFGSKIIHDALNSESADSGIMSDFEGESVDEEDYCGRFQDALR